GPHASSQRTKPVRKALLFIGPGDQSRTFALRISKGNLAVTVAAVASLGHSPEHERPSLDPSPDADVRNNRRSDLDALPATIRDPNDELPGITPRRIIVCDAVDPLDSGDQGILPDLPPAASFRFQFCINPADAITSSAHKALTFVNGDIRSRRAVHGHISSQPSWRNAYGYADGTQISIL